MVENETPDPGSEGETDSGALVCAVNPRVNRDRTASLLPRLTLLGAHRVSWSFG